MMPAVCARTGSLGRRLHTRRLGSTGNEIMTHSSPSNNIFRKTGLATVLGIATLACTASACKGPQAVRGGDGTANPDLDDAAMSTGLDRADVQYLVDKNLDHLYQSAFWSQVAAAAGTEPAALAIWPIANETSEHLDDQMDVLLSAVETSLVNSGAVNVISRERQFEMAAEVGIQQGAIFDASKAAQLGRQLGAKYYVTGKVSSLEERTPKGRRVQYTLFLQVLEIETSMIKFQHQSERSKAIQ